MYTYFNIIYNYFILRLVMNTRTKRKRESFSSSFSLHLKDMHCHQHLANKASHLLWAMSATAASSGFRERESAPWSKFCETISEHKNLGAARGGKLKMLQTQAPSIRLKATGITDSGGFFVFFSHINNVVGGNTSLLLAL